MLYLVTLDDERMFLTDAKSTSEAWYQVALLVGIRADEIDANQPEQIVCLHEIPDHGKCVEVKGVF